MATSSSFLAQKSGNLQEVRAASRQLATGRLEDGGRQWWRGGGGGEAGV